MICKFFIHRYLYSFLINLSVFIGFSDDSTHRRGQLDNISVYSQEPGRKKWKRMQQNSSEKSSWIKTSKKKDLFSFWTDGCGKSAEFWRLHHEPHLQPQIFHCSINQNSIPTTSTNKKQTTYRDSKAHFQSWMKSLQYHPWSQF